MRTWVSDNLAGIWEHLKGLEFEEGEAIFRGRDLPDWLEAVKAANTELVTAQRQRNEAVEALRLLAVTTEREVARVSSQRDEALADNEWLKIEIDRLERELRMWSSV